MKKRIFTLLLACVLAAGTVAGPVGMETVQAGETTTKSELWEYDLDEVDDTDKEIALEGYLGKEENVIIPEWITIKGTDYHVTELGNYRGDFGGFSNIVTVTIPRSVTRIGSGIFQNCSRLEKIVVEEGNPSYESDEAGVLYNKGKTTLILCPEAKQEVNIPGSVSYLSGDPFKNCNRLEKIVVEEGNPSYESDEAGVLYNKGKTRLICCPATKKEVSIPNGVSEIISDAFRHCSSLTSITIPNSVTTLGNAVFRGCSSLTSMTIPDSVNDIGAGIFQDCSSLKELYCEGGQEQWDRWWAIATNPLGWGLNNRFKDVNEFLAIGEEVTVHLNSPVPENPQPDTPQTPEQPQQPQTPQKSDQTITAKNITKTYGAKPFSLNAKANTGTALTYAVSDKKVATVDKKGKVTIKGCGITNITITAPGTDTYNQATKTIKLTVKPKKVTLSSVKSTKKKTATVKWKQDKKAAGYLIQCATDSKFKKNKVQVTVSKNKTVSATVKKLKAGKKYYVRVCAYAKSGKTKVQGDWSKVKTVKVKK